MEREFKSANFWRKELVVDHEMEVPIGAGYGISAACALGTALAIAKILELRYNIQYSCSHGTPC